MKSDTIRPYNPQTVSQPSTIGVPQPNLVVTATNRLTELYARLNTIERRVGNLLHDIIGPSPTPEASTESTPPHLLGIIDSLDLEVGSIERVLDTFDGATR